MFSKCYYTFYTSPQ